MLINPKISPDFSKRGGFRHELFTPIITWREGRSQASPVSVNTVMTVMNRLLDKGHLTKVQTGTGRAQVAKFNTLQSRAVPHGTD